MPEAFFECLDEIRRRLNWTDAQAAEALGLSTAEYRDVERRRIGRLDLQTYARFFAAMRAAGLPASAATGRGP